MLILRIAVLLGLLAPLTCCLSLGAPPEPSADHLAHADYGLDIPEEEAHEKAKAFLDSTLKDPDSAKIKWGSISQAHEAVWVDPSFKFNRKSEVLFGYKMMSEVNAKNSYGGYTGAKPYEFFFSNRNLVAVFTETYEPGYTYPTWARIR